MTTETWWLPVGCFSIIIGHSSVLRAFSGSQETFECTFHPQRMSPDHWVLMAFSQAEVDTTLERLAASGLKLTEDVALASQYGQPLVRCREVDFAEDTGGGGSRWKTFRPVLTSSSASVEDGLVPIDRAGRLLPSVDAAEAGFAIATREAYGAVDGWTEYLCAFRCPWGFEVAALRYRWLGEVPRDWFDDEGDLLPHHLTQDGDIRLPETLWGQPVLACRYGGFVGEFEPVGAASPAWVSGTSASQVSAALGGVGWSVDALLEVQQALTLLGPYRQVTATDPSAAKAPQR